jgi:hypothetical protein
LAEIAFAQLSIIEHCRKCPFYKAFLIAKVTVNKELRKGEANPCLTSVGGGTWIGI